MQQLTEQGGEARLQNAMYNLAMLSFGAGVLHLLAATQFWQEGWPYAAFFMLVAFSQMAAGLVLFVQPWRYDETGGVRDAASRFARPFFILGLLFNGGMIVLWTLAQVAGLTPEATRTTPVTLLGVAATALEAAIVFTLVFWLRRMKETPELT